MISSSAKLRRMLVLPLLALLAAGIGTGFDLKSTTANFTATARNQSNYVTSGTLVLRNTTPAATCLSTGGGGNTDVNDNGSCAVVVSMNVAKPGDSATSTVTLQNEGTLPATALNLWTMVPCGNSAIVPPFTPTAYTGSGNLCTAVAVTVHDDTANQCIYPVAAAGACTVDNAKTLATFTAAAASEANAFQLGPLAAGASKIVSIGTQFDAAAGNQYQGRQAGFSLAWRIVQ